MAGSNNNGTVGQLYESNAGIKFPLMDTHEEDVPNDMLLDMSLSIPAQFEPRVTEIKCTGAIFFMAVEDNITGSAIVTVSVAKPKASTFYAMDAVSSDVHGWVVLGPGCGRAYTGAIVNPIELDPSVVLRTSVDSAAVRYFSLNGVASTVEGFLNVQSTDGSLVLYQTILQQQLPWESAPDNHWTVVVGPAAVKGRALAVLPGGVFAQPPRTIGGVAPDDIGNIQIVGDRATLGGMEVFVVEQDGNSLGISVNCAYEASGERDPILKHMSHGRCGEAVILRPYPDAIKLPLDPILERLNPNYTKEDCGCPKA
jgi:hypothetical protein